MAKPLTVEKEWLQKISTEWQEMEAKGYERRFYGNGSFYGWRWVPKPWYRGKEKQIIGVVVVLLISMFLLLITCDFHKAQCIKEDNLADKHCADIHRLYPEEFRR